MNTELGAECAKSLASAQGEPAPVAVLDQPAGMLPLLSKLSVIEETPQNPAHAEPSPPKMPPLPAHPTPVRLEQVPLLRQQAPVGGQVTLAHVVAAPLKVPCAATQAEPVMLWQVP